MFDPFFFVALGAGALSFFSPCILPLIPSYICFITGASLTQLTENSQNPVLKRRIVVSSLLFILGFSLVFILLGASASFVGQLLYSYQRWISRIGGVFIIFMGLYIAGLVNIPIFNREKRFHLNGQSAGYFVAPLAGIVFAAGWTPCVGPILGSILFYASSTASIGKGILLLGLYSLGLAVPFFFSSLALGVFLHYYGKVRKHTKFISIVAGGILVAVGVMLVADIFPYLSLNLAFF